MSERQGIEIDHCAQCRGVWLDRGELDKIIERSITVGAPRAAEAPPFGDRERYRDDDDYHRHKRRKNWLEDLFD
jgi:Zn-finger nucleic acid-binding protein